MHNEQKDENIIRSKLIGLLCNFSRKEFQSFGDFVRSPYHNKEKVLIRLYDELQKHYPEFSGRDFGKEEVSSAVFPGKKYNDAIFRNTISKLLTLAEKFLTIENFASDEFRRSISLLDGLREKKQEKLFMKHHSSAEELVEKIRYRNEHYYYDKFILEESLLKFKATKNVALTMPDETGQRYQFLLNSFIMQILRANSSIINSNKNIFGMKKDLIMPDEIESHFKKHASSLKENIYFNYYFNSIRLFQTEDEEYFYGLLKIVDNDLDELELNDRKDLVTLLTNFSYYKINHGELKFTRDQFRLYRKNIEAGLYRSNRNFMPHILFMNVVTCGLDAGEFEWVENFIMKYQEELSDEHKDNMYNFSMALYNYRSKNFDKALESAAKIISDDTSYKHQLKSLYLKIYFDMNEVQPFYSHVDSYKHFLGNDKMLKEENKKFIMNYIQFSKKLFDLKNEPGNNKSELTLLKKEILASNQLINKVWLLEKATI